MAVSSDAVDIFGGFIEAGEECKSMHWWTHDG